MSPADPYREYQDYVMAHRLRLAIGQNPGELLSLPQYARLRLQRGALLKRLVELRGDPELLKQIDDLSLQLNFGFWSNPATLKAFLRPLYALPIPELASAEGFESLLSSSELARISQPLLVGRYYLGWLRLPNLVMEPIAFEQAMRQQESLAEQLGLFLDSFHQVVG